MLTLADEYDEEEEEEEGVCGDHALQCLKGECHWVISLLLTFPAPICRQDHQHHLLTHCHLPPGREIAKQSLTYLLHISRFHNPINY